ncbi:MAG: 30S ribosomal protein S16 [Simkaniaceae bacterium]|nr:30S ribosomal protein S16 [Simkaniaceae bacterium]
MALKIRLRQMGRTNRLMYRLVVTDGRSPRDGKYVERVGVYDPHGKGEGGVVVVEDRVRYWLGRGAALTVKAERLVARAAPDVIRELREKQLAKRTRVARKRRKRREKGKEE